MYVSSTSELKAALADRLSRIDITDAVLARKVRLVKSATAPVLAAIVAAAGVGTAMLWNPVGWAALGFAVTAEGALFAAVAFLIASMGAALLWALFNDWEIDASAEAKVKDPSVKVSLKLRPRKK